MRNIEARPKLMELEVVRGMAILAVLLIHVTASATVELSFGSRTQLIYVIVNKMSHFAVPLFILLSGVVLFYRYSHKWTFAEVFGFYRKRLQFIIIPYLIWSAFYYLFNQSLGPEGFQFDTVTWDWKQYWELLPWGDASYHLYFIIIIAQFYLLFPLLSVIVNRWPRMVNWLVPAGLLVQIGFYYYNAYVEPFENLATLWFNYLTVFCVGGWIGKRYETFVLAKRHLPWVLAATVFIGYTMAVLAIVGNIPIYFNGIFNDFIFHSYAIGIGFSFLWIGMIMLRSLPKLAVILPRLGTVSFGIYFIHAAILAIWQTLIIYNPNTIEYHLSLVGSFLVVLLASWLIVEILKKWKGSWILFGK